MAVTVEKPTVERSPSDILIKRVMEFLLNQT